MDSSVFAFAVDLAHEGVDAVLESVDGAGIGGVTLAAAYHHARDVLPHNPRHVVYYHEGGTAFFRPEADYGLVRPVPSRLTTNGDPLGDLCRAAAARGMDARAWTVYLHNSRLASAHPECAPQNAFGDRYLTDLCPSHPEVRRYALALTADLVRYPVASIMAEALHFKPFDHGYHHERLFLDLGPFARFLLGLCFCSWCREAAQRNDVDGDATAAAVRRLVRRWLDAGGGGHEPVTRAAVIEAVGAGIDGYLDARQATVTSLAADVGAVASAAGVTFTFSAHGGSARGGDTRSRDDAAAAWMLGVDLPAVAAAVGEFEMLGYAAEADEVAAVFAGYAGSLPQGTPLAAALRPMWPDTASAANLTAKVAAARAAGAGRVDFYHYGLMPLGSLDWIAAALH